MQYKIDKTVVSKLESYSIFKLSVSELFNIEKESISDFKHIRKVLKRDGEITDFNYISLNTVDCNGTSHTFKIEPKNIQTVFVCNCMRALYLDYNATKDLINHLGI